MAEYEPLVIERAEGCTLYDLDGRAYLDGVSSLWCNIHGHRHPQIDAAICRQLDKAAHVTNLGSSNPTTIELAKRLVDLAPPGLDHVFFSDDGATAVEVALKMAFQCWRQRGLSPLSPRGLSPFSPGSAEGRSAEKKGTVPFAVRTVLESTLGDCGFDAEPTSRRLEAFMAVQNTYLSTFQSLGALGLLLGTVGLAVVQLRSVLERRGELALMRAVGFRRRRLAGMVLLENTALLVGGLATGAFAAMIAILPQLAGRSASTPWLSLAGTLIAVLAVGLTAGLVAVRATLRAPLIPALREE